MAQNFIEHIVDYTSWKIPNRYTDLKTIGVGAFGTVCSAFDRLASEKLRREIRVAIKNLKHPFETVNSAKRTNREICLLKHVLHENVIKLIDVFTTSDTPENLNNVYLVTNFLGTDLNKIIKNHELDDHQIMFLTYQILRGLKYLHTSNIIHRDLKPSNLIVDENCTLKIIDFGLSRCESDEMTGYVATRWYRAPELILNMMKYTKAMDLWSVGCIIVEMFTKTPLFPGENLVGQIQIILALVGIPEEKLLQEINQDLRGFLSRLGNIKRVDFHNYFNSKIQNPLAIGLIDKLLVLNPDDRFTVIQALEHGYMLDFHDSDDEPSGESFVVEYENNEHTMNEWKIKIFNEIQDFVIPEITEND